MTIVSKNSIRNMKWLGLAWTFYTLTFLFQVSFLTEYKSVEDNLFIWTNLFSGYLVAIFLICFFIVPIHHSLREFPIRKKVLVLFVLGFFFCLLYMVLTTGFQSILLKKAEWDWLIHRVWQYIKYDLHNVYKTYIFLTVLLVAIDYFQRQNQWIKEEGELRQKLIHLQLENLKNQFQPHFLFNALNSIVAVIDENKKKAQNMLILLSDILRLSIDLKHDCRHTLEKEIIFLRKYLVIEKLRYEEQLEFKFEVDPESKDILLPCLILQPLIENAIKHGFRGNRRNLQIIVIVSNGRSIKIKNNGSPLNNYKEGVGLNSVREKLEVLYGGNARFSISQEKDWVVNQLDLKEKL